MAKRSRAITRRRFLRDAAAASAAAGLANVGIGGIGLGALAKSRPSTVAILGGGVAGLTAAHELAERGFAVTVYEPKALGGKARSIPVPNSGRGGRRDLPGEHGFRFFPGFYQNVPDSMLRIPFPGNSRGVFSNLVDASKEDFAFKSGHGSLYLPTNGGPLTPAELEQTLIAGLKVFSMIPANEIEYFARKMVVFVTSSDARRFGEWEHVSWWDYVNAANFSPAYQKYLGHGLSRDLVAAKGETGSSRTIALMGEALIMSAFRRGPYQAPDRVLNAPTNEAWIDPWVAHLTKLGVSFQVGGRVTGLETSGGRVQAAVLQAGRSTRQVNADWFVCAMPVEKMRTLLSPAVLAADPSLASLNNLQTDWMNGIQFYLSRPPQHLVAGHVTYMDSPWALTSINQAQFWPGRNLPADYGDGRVHDILSIDVSDFQTPGIVYGKPAAYCSPKEIAKEVWEQVKAHLNLAGDTELTDDMLVRWFLDPAIFYPSGAGHKADNQEPLLINTVGSWYQRPQPGTGIQNLFLAADYVQVNIDLATMEGANEAARGAVNALLHRAGSSASPAPVYNLYMPPEMEPFKQTDAQLYALGQPNEFDAVPAGGRI